MKRLILVLMVIFSNKSNGYCQFSDSLPAGLATSDSISSSLHKKVSVNSFIMPAVFIGYGLVSLTGDNAIRRLDYSTNAELQEDHPAFLVKADNYLRYAPAIAVYGLDLVGIKARSNVPDRSLMLLGSYALVSVTTGTIKGFTNRLRPSGFNTHSFPSGHTSIAFMTAEFLHQEYKDQSIWYSVGGYTLATGTAILRLYNNAHWVSDVVAGAGFGILSTKIIYLVYPYVKRKLINGKANNIIISPGYQNSNLHFTLIKRL